MDRHELLAALHARLQPRNYLEIGVDAGASLALSRVPSIGIDPGFAVVHEIDCDVQLVRATSDDYFRSHNPTEKFDGEPVDLAFIDGMHLAEFALRDFIYVEAYSARTSVIVFDDMLPRNVVEAARDRQTVAWTGDVFKVTHVLRHLRPDLVVLEVDTEPTGTVVVLLPDARSTALAEHYNDIEAAMVADGDPQDVPESVLGRTRAVDPYRLLQCAWWETLVAERQGRVARASLSEELAQQDWTELRAAALGVAPLPSASRA
ncbi:class I SAM-dependent methyltransferase [Geodermatophilus marinus]|uniref:class I SAM-dependent methyltransferase n=1 Tax=Geodermatophilus sp. LHW52908 TaxID=2303986 RepID=UPI000E3B8655|nr:class I SAM-dependent methyltransferase [Geodermatophilus sp. LHW52908]RFU23062.1 class I SAM-dependent methyltransferase [Geodermatophilus sp. LHW52908]